MSFVATAVIGGGALSAGSRSLAALTQAGAQKSGRRDDIDEHAASHPAVARPDEARPAGYSELYRPRCERAAKHPAAIHRPRAAGGEYALATAQSRHGDVDIGRIARLSIQSEYGPLLASTTPPPQRSWRQCPQRRVQGRGADLAQNTWGQLTSGLQNLYSTGAGAANVAGTGLSQLFGGAGQSLATLLGRGRN